MQVVLTGGGTGGHVYPGLAVAGALRDATGGEVALVWIGTSGGAEAELAVRAHVPFHAVHAAGVRGRSPVGVARGVLTLAAGTVQAWRLLARKRPDVVFATGGYASVPVAVAAWLRRTPLVVYLPDLEPGWAVRFLARLAARVAVTAEEAARRLPRHKTAVTGYPVREGFGAVERAEARRRLGLDPELRTVLVSGATHGAHSINRAVANALPGLLELGQVIHLCGRRDEPWLRELRERLPEEVRARYLVFGYLTEMPLAMAAADLAVLRSGASVLGELPMAGLPAVLVPYPHAGAHQRANAAYLAGRGGAVVLDDADLERLLPLVRELLADGARLEAMAAAMRALARPDAAQAIARIIQEVAA
ncbi:MAG TPA: UDP-N-acetylglucosamine--N-acetylmuramyl-(pentapeptide) pyrophosphoryl-undecaprenol N-acetylglucosamine transferase [Dehalococcoidia bacterium]